MGIQKAASFCTFQSHTPLHTPHTTLRLYPLTPLANSFLLSMLFGWLCLLPSGGLDGQNCLTRFITSMNIAAALSSAFLYSTLPLACYLYLPSPYHLAPLCAPLSHQLRWYLAEDGNPLGQFCLSMDGGDQAGDAAGIISMSPLLPYPLPSFPHTV